MKITIFQNDINSNHYTVTTNFSHENVPIIANYCLAIVRHASARFY